MRSRLVFFLVIFPLYTAQAAEKSTWDIGGNIMLDADVFSRLFNEDSNSTKNVYYSESELRRARISAKYHYGKYWSSKLQYNVEDEGSEYVSELKDANVTYKGLENVNISVGKQKQPFGLEGQMSSRNLVMIERSVSTNVISPDRSIGVNLDGLIYDLYWNMGYFSARDGDEDNGISGRLIYQAFNTKNTYLHIGSSTTNRQLKGDEIRVNSTLEVHSADSFVEGDKIDASHIQAWGVESLVKIRGLNVLGEWLSMKMKDDKNEDDTLYYQGGYVQFSYLAGKAQRKVKGGLLASTTTPKGYGNLEIAYRFSGFSLIEEEEKTYSHTIGLNYYPSKHVKFMANYISAELYTGGRTRSGNAFSFRAQVSF